MKYCQFKITDRQSDFIDELRLRIRKSNPEVELNRGEVAQIAFEVLELLESRWPQDLATTSGGPKGIVEAAREWLDSQLELDAMSV